MIEGYYSLTSIHIKIPNFDLTKLNFGMDSKQDIRWHQQFENYQKALVHLNNAVALSKERDLTDLEKQGLIKGFEYTHELAWKTMQDFLKGKGETKIIGSRDATRLAFNYEIILKGQVWMDMIDDQNLTSHTYNEEVIEKLSDSGFIDLIDRRGKIFYERSNVLH